MADGNEIPFAPDFLFSTIIDCHWGNGIWIGVSWGSSTNTFPLDVTGDINGVLVPLNGGGGPPGPIGQDQALTGKPGTGPILAYSGQIDGDNRAPTGFWFPKKTPIGFFNITGADAGWSIFVCVPGLNGGGNTIATVPVGPEGLSGIFDPGGGVARFSYDFSPVNGPFGLLSQIS